MKYILLTSTEEYNSLNAAVSTARGYPYRKTEMYAPAEPEEVIVTSEQVVTNEADEVETITVETTLYKFPLADDIMSIVAQIAGKKIYNADGSTFFEQA